MELIMLFKFKRMPTKKELEEANKIVDESVKKGLKIEVHHTYGIYDTITYLRGDDDSEEAYLTYLQLIKPWADVYTLHVINEDLYQKVTKKSIKD
ncbi:hypothetical protein [Picrophilus oshimae]|nr:hypothetical protein [Picrophilus oshimae]